LAAVLAEAQDQHAADRIYVSLLAPETQGEIHGQTLTSLPLSVANALEPLRNAQDAGLNGESAELVGEAPAGGVLSGFWILNLHIEPGGLN
ncbi:MAG: SpoIVB peptidase S55, partial [Terracidiphilus sp.]